MAGKKRLNNPKTVERAKTVVLVALVLCCICLVVSVVSIQGRLNGKDDFFWFVNTPHDAGAGASGETVNTLTAFSVLYEPEVIMINGADGRHILDEESDIYNRAIESINIIIKDLHSSNAECSKLSDYAEWDNALKVNSIYVKYPCSRKTEFEAQFYEINNSVLSSNIAEYTEILLVASNADSGTIAMIPTEDGVLKIKTNISPVAINEIIMAENNENEKAYAFASELNLDKREDGKIGENARKVVLDRNVIVPSRNVIADNILIDVPWKYKNEINFTEATELTTKLIDIFGYNPNTIRQYSDMNEALVFVSDSGTVKAHPNGTIEYKALTKTEGLNLATVVQGKTGNVYSVTSGLVETVRKIYSICADETEGRDYKIKLTSIPQKVSLGDDMKFEMDYFVDGRRVELAEGHAVEATVSGGMLTELKLQVRTIKKTEGKTEMKSLFEAIDEFCSEHPGSNKIVNSNQIYSVTETEKEISAEWEIKGI